MDTSTGFLVHVELRKGRRGFGFSLANTAAGQVVSQVLDESRCLPLAVGDVLVEIDRRPIGGWTHGQVVALLRGARYGEAVSLTLLRPNPGTSGKFFCTEKPAMLKDGATSPQATFFSIKKHLDKNVRFKKFSSSLPDLAENGTQKVNGTVYHKVDTKAVSQSTMVGGVSSKQCRLSHLFDKPKDYAHEKIPRHVELLKKSTEKCFGFTLNLQSSKGHVYVDKIRPTTPASRSPLKPGHRILLINGHSVNTVKRELICEIIKSSGKSLILTVDENIRNNAHYNDAKKLRLLKDQSVKENQKMECFDVTLKRGPDGYGFSVRGGAEFGDLPIKILQLASNRSAILSGKLKAGDLIEKINDMPTMQMTQREFIEDLGRSTSVKLSIFPCDYVMTTVT